MTRFEREVLEEAKKIVAAAGGRCRYEGKMMHGKHGRLIVEIGGHSRFTPVHSSPGRPVKALWYKMGDVKRIVRELRCAIPSPVSQSIS